MERIQDLLVEKEKKGVALRVKEGKDSVYVEGVENKPVQNYDAIKQWLAFGDKNRSIAATAMNKTSSRSHTVLQIKVVKVSAS